MKKIFLYILAGSLCFTACKKDDEVPTYQEPEDINVQNTYDDQAITKFMNENYLDAQGNIKPFSATDTSDDKETKLSDLKYTKLPSGTIYIMREGAQPAVGEGKVIGSDDIIKIMGKADAYQAIDNNGTPVFSAKSPFLNTIDGVTIPFVDPAYYYAKSSVRTDNKQERPYFEIAGFREALQKFTAFKDLPNSTPYNLQGVIIVPSRAAFARNPHYPYFGYSYRNKSFVFNFQIYGTEVRPDKDK
ncbi:hypothetical protein [Chryseobacterium jejuense]|uniref:Uncharacterized protein n=1 Tax=Chryseobacterium jejuense TaxID=445960 RepID=A0A2X2WUY6_CHRJE|nr:hypothetical protein [Chryseobacterium jejuense]SDJ64028.1 hypothetical protein SAMN05421542_3987 [Chryseobacterium jejuense]SQB43347.1 Uncharacterised protein [Chryseobacterium jejuense]